MQLTRNKSCLVKGQKSNDVSFLIQLSKHSPEKGTVQHKKAHTARQKTLMLFSVQHRPNDVTPDRALYLEVSVYPPITQR